MSLISGDGMKRTKSTRKMEKIKAKWTQVTLKNVLKVKDPKLSRVLIVQNNVYAAVQGAIGEDRLQETCSFLLGNHHTFILTNSYGCSRGQFLGINSKEAQKLPLMWLIEGLQSWAVIVDLKFIGLEWLQKSRSEQRCFGLNVCFFRIQGKSNISWWGASKDHVCEWWVASLSKYQEVSSLTLGMMLQQQYLKCL